VRGWYIYDCSSDQILPLTPPFSIHDHSHSFTKTNKLHSRTSINLISSLSPSLFSRKKTTIHQTVKMQFNIVALTLAAMASVAAAQSTVTVYACSSSGVASPTVKSIGTTGVSTGPTSTGSPITPATGAASMNHISGSALGMIVAGGVALLI